MTATWSLHHENVIKQEIFSNEVSFQTKKKTNKIDHLSTGRSNVALITKHAKFGRYDFHGRPISVLERPISHLR